VGGGLGGLGHPHLSSGVVELLGCLQLQLHDALRSYDPEWILILGGSRVFHGQVVLVVGALLGLSDFLGGGSGGRLLALGGAVGPHALVVLGRLLEFLVVLAARQ